MFLTLIQANDGELYGWQDEGFSSFKRYPQAYPFLWKRRAFTLAKLGLFRDALSDIQLALRNSDETIEGSFEIAERFLVEADIQEAWGNEQAALQSLTRALQYLQQNDSAVRSSTFHEEHLKKLKRRVQPWDCDETKRVDPVNRVPPEIIEKIMQFGLEEDKRFVLNATHVSRRWRSLLTDLPSLWRAFTWIGSESGDKHDNLQRHRFWTDNNQGDFRKVKLADLHTGSLDRGNDWKKLFAGPSEISLEYNLADYEQPQNDLLPLLNHAALDRLSMTGPHMQSPWGALQAQLVMGVLTEETTASLRHLSLANMKYFHMMNQVLPSHDYRFDSLLSFTARACDFKVSQPAIAYQSTLAPGSIFDQTDHLHNALARMPQLRKLCLTDMDPHDYEYHPQQYSDCYRMVELHHLESLRAPPPAFWALQIKTPFLRELYYVLSEATRWCSLRGLLPSMATLAPTQIPVHKLVRVELTINLEDDMDTLTEWFEALESVEWLKITSTQPLQSKPESATPGQHPRPTTQMYPPDPEEEDMDLIDAQLRHSARPSHGSQPKSYLVSKAPIALAGALRYQHIGSPTLPFVSSNRGTTCNPNRRSSSRPMYLH